MHSENLSSTTTQVPQLPQSDTTSTLTAKERAAQLKQEALEKYGPGVQISPRTGRPKRRKANRACVHCQRTHLTCDNGRPCERCVQRGLAETCRDGTRKKAKYLQDVPDAEVGNNPPAALRKKHKPAKQQQNKPQVQVEQTPHHPMSFPKIQQVAALSNGLDPAQLRNNSHNFQSSAINSEYRILSNMLSSNRSPTSSTVNPSLTTSSPSMSEGSPGESSTGFATQYHSTILNHFTLNGGSGGEEQNLTDILSTIGGEEAAPKRPISFAITDTAGINSDPGIIADTAPFSSSLPDWRRLKEPGDVYANIRKPFSYTPGFHALTSYLKTRFTKDKLIQMSKCMARYRPSFIACTNTLKEDDLIFMEQCFQRTLLEYEKFISYSGTPTIVWRRTGQITAVGKEFCILTGWSRERLLDQRTFIVELMDDDSVLEYFEMFSNIAFGDSRGAMMSGCTLITPAGSRLKTACMWTLKRDVFGIPMMIIGNFLPVLS